MSLYKRGGTWWLYIVHGGRRYRRSTGESQRARAQRVHDELKADLWKRRRSGGSLHGALEAWVEGKVGPDVYRVRILKKRLPDTDLGSLNLKAIAAAVPSSTPGTYNRYLNILRAAGIQGLKRKKTPKGRIRWITAEEWNRLRDALPDHQRPMAELAITTGLRQANVFRLEWRQVDLKRGVAWVHPDQAKAGDAINVPLQADALRVLRAQHKLTGAGKWVFLGKDGKPPTEIKAGWKRALLDAEIQDFTWHDLRHTWATWHVMNGTPLEVLQKLGGWADLRMVMRYAHLADSFVAQYAGNAKPYQPLGHKSRHSRR